MEKEIVCAVAIDAATFAIDKLYEYRVPNDLRDDVQIGCRVLVPFGRGNQQREGIVVQFCDGGALENLKNILSTLDKVPTLSTTQIRLAAWMREHLYCTFFDCIRVMAPTGLQSKQDETYTLSDTADIADLSTRGDLYGALLQQFTAPGQSISAIRLQEIFHGQNISDTLDVLTREGILICHNAAARRSTDQTEKMLALQVDVSEALSRVGKRSAARLEVIEALSNGAWMSQKELSYLTGASASTLNDMIRKELLQARYVKRLCLPDFSDIPRTDAPILSDAQQTVFEQLTPLLDKNQPAAALLFGVTGSGKTLIYLRLIACALQQGKSTIMLVPEIGLTPQFLQQFAAQFGNLVVVQHSALSAGERSDGFQRIQSGRARIVLGTRSAIFAPVQNLGLIILDEEQDSAYQSGRTPRYHARDIARYRAVHENAFVLFGSATPSIETYYGAEQGKYPMFTLSERFMGTALPKVTIADMRGLKREGHQGVIGPELERQLQETLEHQKQAILFLNRRGNSRVIGCASCGWAPECPHCSTNMTYHSVSKRILCHFCGASMKAPTVCPECGDTELFTAVPGTQKVEEELREKFPSARILRMDTDAMHTKGAHEKTLNEFSRRKADILIGTQMVAKGLDFENVTLVGVLDADQSLYAADFRAREKTFSLITQVVGRAGRRFDTGRAVIQTYNPSHSVILAAARQDYVSFFTEEIQLRETLACPPAIDLTILTAVGIIEQQVINSLQALKIRLQNLMEGQFATLKTTVLGPAAAQTVRVCGRYRYYLTLRSSDSVLWRKMIAGVLREFQKDRRNKGVSLLVTHNTYLD